MADAFYSDLGIDVRVVTTNDAADSIETQANETFERKQIGRESPVGGVLVILNPGSQQRASRSVTRSKVH